MSSLKLIGAVGIGGMIGAIGRYIIAETFPVINQLPLATLAVNLIGCFLLSYMIFSPFIKRKIKPELFTGLTVGVLGSFTTFSTVILELYDLSNISKFYTTVYLLSSMFGGLLFCYIGFKLATIGDQNG